MLYYKIKVLCPNIKDTDFTLQNNSDGNGDFIAAWKSTEYEIPTKEELDSVSEQATQVQNVTVTRNKRASEYPPIGDQLDALLKQLSSMENITIIPEMQDIIDKWQGVKGKYPLT
jgi:hypothetical protein